MISHDQLRDVQGSTAYDRDGDKIGKIAQVYFDDDTDQPKWFTVNTGLFGTHESFVPVQGAEFTGDRVTVAYDKATVKDAPNTAEDGHLSPQEEERLYRHYSIDYAGGSQYASDTATTATTGTGRTDRTRAAGHDTSGPNTDNAMTRSEERLTVGTETREAGRARLRKYVVTEHQSVSVPVSREEVRIEREPITDANRDAAYDGAALSEEEYEVVLREERPVVDKETVAVERVRFGVETVTDTETVTGEVRKEKIEIDDPTRTKKRRRR